jgi:hypothetical protein
MYSIVALGLVVRACILTDFLPHNFTLFTVDSLNP